jgi:hypothetical protein
MTWPVRYLFASFFALIIAALVFHEVSNLQLFTTYEVLILALLFGGSGYGIYGFREYGLSGRFGILLFTNLLCMLVLIGVLLQQMGPGFSNPGRVSKLTFIVLLFLFFIGVSINQYTYLKKTGAFLLAFAVLFSIYVSHTVGLAPDSGTAAFALIAGFTMGLCLFVLPRYISSGAFLWTVSLICSIMVLIGIRAYYIGDYEILGMSVALADGTFTPLFMNKQIHALQSVFVNPNMTGIIMFVGTVSSAILIHRLFPDISSNNESQEVRADGSSATVLSYPFVFSLGISCLAGCVFVINTVGLYFSQSRASFLAAAVSLALYFSYMSFGRRSLPYALAGLVGAITLFLLLLPVIGINPAGRFALWTGSIEYLAEHGTLLGEGIVGSGDLIKPYVTKPYRGQAPHNSYLSTFIRAGLLGGAVYLFLIAGSLIAGVVQYQHVDVPALALAFGFAIHQIFESYSLFQNSIPAIIASLSFGFLILSGVVTEDDQSTDRHGRRRRSHDWSRPEWKQ